MTGMTKGTPASSQIVFLEQRVAVLEDDNERMRAVLTKADKLYRICDGEIPEPENIKAVWDDTKASVRAALETREAGVSSEGK